MIQCNDPTLQVIGSEVEIIGGVTWCKLEYKQDIDILHSDPIAIPGKIHFDEKELNTRPICPAQDKKTLKCYSKAFWEAKPGTPEICTRPCKFEKQIEDWNERHGKD